MADGKGQCRPVYRTSSFSGGGDCVEVGLTPGGGTVEVRHSFRPDDASVTFSADEWRAFILGVKAGEFDPI